MAMLALAPLAFAQCSDDKGGNKNDVPAAVVTLPDEYQSLQWTDQGGQKSITISSNVDLTPETSADWVTVTPATSYAKGVLKFFVECAENASIENREAEVSFTAADGTTVKITIRQSGKADMSLTAKDVIGRIKAGVNIGNTMEATGGETSWGNPQVNATYIAGLKDIEGGDPKQEIGARMPLTEQLMQQQRARNEQQAEQEQEEIEHEYSEDDLWRELDG